MIRGRWWWRSVTGMDIRPRDLSLRTYIGDYAVSTVALTVEHHGGMWYETYIFPAKDEKITDWSEVWGERWPDKATAETQHERVCADLRAGILEGYDGEPL